SSSPRGQQNQAMTTQTNSRRGQALKVLIALSLPVLVLLWWAFRPEKLFVNQKVNEPAPFTTAADSQPILSGKLETQLHPTIGPATIYKSSDGRQYLRLTNFETSNGPDVHVILVSPDDQKLGQNMVKGDLESIELGSLKGNQGDQNYDLP